MYTPRENFIHYFKNEPVEWIPMSSDMLAFHPEEFSIFIARGFVKQQHPFPPSKYGGKDLFGVEWYYDPNARGSMEVSHILSDISEWREKIVFPDLDSFDWEGIRQRNADYLNTDKIIAVTIFSGYFERLISFLGFEDAAIALIDEEQQEDVHALFDRLTEFYIGFIKRFHHYFGVERVCLHDDWGTQRGLIFSPETHREMIRPYVMRIIDAVHAEGMFFEMHSCGKVGELVPTMMEMGVDTWAGQDRADLNHKDELIAEYGDRFKFGVILPAPESKDLEATKDEIRKSVEKYVGKNVWIRPALAYTPEQIEYCTQINKELCKKL